jgi:hypothetical protein
LLPPSLLLPEARLQVLLEQALEAQRSACRVHNTDRRQMSLLHDHLCVGQIPTHTLQILDDHTDEVRMGSARLHTRHRVIRSTRRPYVLHYNTATVGARRPAAPVRWDCVSNARAHQQCSGSDRWDLSGERVRRVLSSQVWHVAWSPNGKHLAAASRDETVRVWAVRAPAAACTLTHTLRGHTAAVQFVAWSPDSQLLLSCGNDGKVPARRSALLLWSHPGEKQS